MFLVAPFIFFHLCKRVYTPHIHPWLKFLLFALFFLSPCISEYCKKCLSGTMLGIFPKATPQVTFSQLATSQMCNSMLGLLRRSWLQWVPRVVTWMGQWVVCRGYDRLWNKTPRKSLIGKIFLRSYCLGNNLWESTQHYRTRCGRKPPKNHRFH